MIHIAETLAVHSIEGFLTPADVADLTAIMDTFLADGNATRYGPDRHSTIHEIPGHSARAAMAVYEPAGRTEIVAIPDSAQQILAAATDRALAAITRALPSITTCRPWNFVQYQVGQNITGHLDGIAPDPAAYPRQIAGISVVITPAQRGGEFFVETTGSDNLWHRPAPAGTPGYAPHMTIAHDGADASADWYRQMPRTRWTVNPAPGTALLYGSQLTHGTEPVIAGTARKFISWLIAEHPDTAKGR